MREYINRLSRGKFRYDIPDIIQPDDVIIEDVICDTIHNAEFHIQAQDVIKGVVYSDNAKVTVLTPSFAGKDSYIKVPFFSYKGSARPSKRRAPR